MIIRHNHMNLLISSMYFCYFVIITPWKRAGPFIWTNLNPLYSRMLCAKFGWNWPCGFGEVDENVKSLQTDGQTNIRTDRQTGLQNTDERWSEKLTWAFSSGELKIEGNPVEKEEERKSCMFVKFLCVHFPPQPTSPPPSSKACPEYSPFFRII